MIALASFAIAFPIISTLAVEMTVAGLFLIAEAFTGLDAFYEKLWGGFAWETLIGIVYLVGGAIMLVDPVGGTLALTIYLGAVVFSDGLFLTILGIRLRRMQRWGWIVASGVLSILLSALVFVGIPSGASSIVPGLSAGMNVIFAGVALVFFGLELRDGEIAASGHATLGTDHDQLDTPLPRDSTQAQSASGIATRSKSSDGMALRHAFPTLSKTTILQPWTPEWTDGKDQSSGLPWEAAARGGGVT